MAIISKHSKERIVERNDDITTFAEAKKVAKYARTAGETINHYNQYPKFFAYLQSKRYQTNECSIRIYRGCVYIWRGKSKTLVTAIPIPDRFKEEMAEIDAITEVK